MKVMAGLFLAAALAITVLGQRPRTLDTSSTPSSPKTSVAQAPQSVKAKYEGGVFGYNKAMDGTLNFDDTNTRLIFRNKQQKEVFFIPYEAVTSAFADTQKRQPAAATVVSHVPLIYALPAHFIKTKVRYLTVHYSDPDTKVAGITSFKLENKEVLASVLRTLVEKTGMTARGEVYVKKKDADPNKLNP
ncbi:MAG: hypothetical protein ACREBG_12595 [Pyrinomonadaceae bacterium]